MPDCAELILKLHQSLHSKSCTGKANPGVHGNHRSCCPGQVQPASHQQACYKAQACGTMGTALSKRGLGHGLEEQAHRMGAWLSKMQSALG